MGTSQKKKQELESKRNKVIEMAKSGHSLTEIVESMSLSSVTVRKYLDGMKIPNYLSICTVCSVKFPSDKPKSRCSKECDSKFSSDRERNKRNDKYINSKENYDYVCCKICGHKGADLGTHLTNFHDMNSEKYKRLYGNDSKIKCDKLIENLTGDKNPAYQHGGKYSPFSKNFLYSNQTNIDELITKAKNTKQANNNDTTKVEYYLKLTKGNQEEAERLLSERQSTFSLNKCIKKYGKEKGREVWLERQEKWHNSYKKSNFSKISQLLFWDIVEKLDNLDYIHFAQLGPNKEKDLSGNNNEIRLKLDLVILPDFIDTKTKKIIEFDGTYWHGKVGQGNKEREQKRNEVLLKEGFKILHIKESDYKQDKQGTITKCLNFLKQ